MSFSEHLVRSLLWVGCSKAATQIISFVSTLIVARQLMPQDYGVMALAGFWIAALSAVSELGVGGAVIQFQDLEHRELNALFIATVILAMLVYGVLYLVAPLIAQWLDHEQLEMVLRVGGVAVPLATLRVVPDSLLRKRLAFDKLATVSILSSMAAIPVVLSLAFLGAGVWALVASMLVATSVQTAGIFGAAGWRPSGEVGSDRTRSLLRFCGQTFGGRMCWSIYQQLDVFILGKIAGAESVGVYSMAMQLITMPIDKAFSLVNEISYAAMARLQKDRDALRASFVRSTRILAALACPVYVGAYLVGEDLIPLVLSDRWESAGSIFRILAPYGLLTSLAVLLSPLLLARYRSDVVLSYTIAQVVLMPLGFWIGASQGGAPGVAFAWLTVYPIALSWLVAKVLREIELSWEEFGAAVLPICGAGILMGVVVWIVQSVVTPWLHLQMEMRLFASIVSGVAVYPLVLWVMARAVAYDLWQLGHQMLTIRRSL